MHHGGAGTVAAGLQLGLPTMVVPFFGDQHLWGSQVARLGVGPPPVPMEALSVDRLTDGFRLLTRSRYREAAARLARQMAAEDGVLGASEAFHDQLPLGAMLCDLGLWLGTEDQDENADAGAGAGAGAGDGSILSPLGDTLPPASTGEGEACTIDITDDGAFNGGGCAAAAVGGPRVAAVWYPELRLKVSAAAHLVISARYQATDIPNAGPELVANPHVLKRWRGGRAAGARYYELFANPSPNLSPNTSPSPNPNPNPNPTLTLTGARGARRAVPWGCCAPRGCAAAP